jgi:hypothetical protein
MVRKIEENESLKSMATINICSEKNMMGIGREATTVGNWK